MKQFRHIAYFLLILLLLGGVANKSWGAEVRYHILTLPFNVPNQNGASGNFRENIRVEALLVKSTVNTVGLPDDYKSPLAKGFKYYKGWSSIYDYLYDYSTNNRVIPAKFYLYSGDGTDEIHEGDPVGSLTDIYVIYEFDSTKGIILDGTQDYNINVGGTKFLCLNRSRNNRPAAANAAALTPEYLASSDFVLPEAGTKANQIGFNWSNDQWAGAHGLHLGFKLVGNDPYNITLMTAYTGNEVYNSNDKLKDDSKAYYEPYRGATIFAKVTVNGTDSKMWFDSDNDLHYKSSDQANWDIKDQWPGYYRGVTYPIFNAVAILNHPNGGYVFVGSKFNQGDNKSANKEWAPSNGKYATLTNDNLNPVLKFNELGSSPVINIYEIRDYVFKVKTPFGNEVSASIKLSEYTVNNDKREISISDIPTELKRKYCSFEKFYKDAALTEEIQYYSELTEAPYNIYVGYTVDMPFETIGSDAGADAYKTATWYELTDAGSTQEYGRKIKWNAGSPGAYKNNGANGEYVKESEFAFVGDPYEVKVLYRKGTEDAGSNSYVTLSTHDSWDIPDDDTDGSFLLRKFNDTGYWSWNAVQPTQVVRYGTDTALPYSAGKDAQTITFNLSGLDGSKYYKITTDGTDKSQIVSVTPAINSVIAETATAATITVSLAANTTAANKTMTVTIQEYDDNEGKTASGTPSIITITQGTSSSLFTASTVEYSTTNSTRVKVLKLPKRDFTYNIVDKAGNIAAKATASQTIYSPLSVASIPSIILSPFILDETITFYTSYGETGRGNLSSDITQLPLGSSASSTNIYVKYTTSKLDQKGTNLSESQEFNVKLNGQYLYYDATNDVIKTNDSPNSSDLSLPEYLWKLRGRDPYAMLIDNMGARIDLGVANQTENPDVYDDSGTKTKPERQMGAWVKLAATLGNDVALTFDTNRANAQRFIAKASTEPSAYEVMVATNTVDASATTGVAYYNIGCPTANTVKIYDNNTYAHGNAVLKFILNLNVTFTYHLIDLAKHELLEATGKTPDLALPVEYQSPLVGKYHYYDVSDIVSTSTSGGTEYKPREGAEEITNLLAIYTKTSSNSSQWEGADENHRKTVDIEVNVDAQAKELKSEGHFYFKVGTSEPYTYYHVNVTKAYHDNIYVTYDKNNLVTFNSTSSPYMLKFLNPYADGYFLEDGNDKLTTTKIQAVYPYCNGDGTLNVYGDDMQKEQFNGGASTRPRWVWFFESENNDPYHVKIHSKSEIEYKKTGVKHPTYLQTYAVHFNQDVSSTTYHIVTGGILAGIASVDPTEYMILGTAGQYKLLTTYPVAIDLNGDGDTNDTGESVGERQYVQSFEQYWKTYNMIKQCLLEIDTKSGPYKDEFSNDKTKWVVPTEQRSTIDTKLVDKGIGSGNWHSYEVIANAVRWNGYDDKEKANTKLVEKLEHWFQTFDMGDGTFDIESADIPPVLVLLDRHGWEVMRKPLGYNSSSALEVLRSYDSPMVKGYKFYSNATKATGCHKYVLRMQNGAERDQIKVNGKHYTSTSLGDLPPETASGVKDNTGAFNDQFVTYTVKEEYENSYQYHLELHDEDKTFEEWGTPSKFLVLQNGRYIRKVENDDKVTSYLSKPIFEATNPIGGNVYDMILSPSTTDYKEGYYAPDHFPVGTGDGIIDDQNLWYIQPNLKIDEEMGIKWAQVKGQTLEPHTEYETKKEYKDKTGFDPYNIQLKNASTGKYLTTHISTTSLSNGEMIGNYTGGNNNVTLEIPFTSYDPSTSRGSEGYDHTNIQMSNQTFMAVSDAEGNMQLMPRFDHTMRMNIDAGTRNTTLEAPVNHKKASVDNNSSMGPQTTFFVRPQVFEYHIIDNEGNEALRYKTAGEYIPSIPKHLMSPLATDFKYYFGYAAGTTSASSKDSRDAAATSNYFKKEAASDEAMATAAKALTVVDDYYFKVGAGTEESPYTYKKVTVTKGHSGTTDATYTFTDCTKNDYDNAVAYQHSSTDDADFVSDAKELDNKGLHYFQIGPTTLYRKVTVSGTTKTVEESNDTEWSSNTGTTPEDMTAYETAVDALSENGTYYYKINYYLYKKVIVTNINNSFSTEVHNHADISSREITGTFAEVGLNDMINQVYVRYSYNASSDVDEILQGKWFTIKLANKDVQASGALTFHKTVVGESEYTAAKDALSSDGVYYFRISDGAESPTYTYKKVTITSGTPAGSDDSSESEWTTSLGTGVSLYSGTKSDDAPIDGSLSRRKWQWKFLAAPMDPSSEYYTPVDPYAVQLFNREKNYTTDLLLDPNPMSVGIKVNGHDRFSLLNHPSGGYALAVNGLGTYSYDFLNGAAMAISVAATTATEQNYQRTIECAKGDVYDNVILPLLTGQPDGLYVFKIYVEKKVADYKKYTVTAGTPGAGVGSSEDEWNAAYHFTMKSGVLSPGTQLVVNDDVSYNYTYNVINNAGKLAVSATQDKAGALEHNYVPYLPFDIQTPLLDIDKDYEYYGSAIVSAGTYTVVPATKLVTLYGLYNDELYVRYKAYSMDDTGYKVPNKRNELNGGTIAVADDSKETALNISGGLPYNIIWEGDNMMQSTNGSDISSGGSHKLDGATEYVWRFYGNDPYAIQIKYGSTGNYVDGTSELNATAKNFMLLRREGYDYGVLAVTGDQDKLLSGNGDALVTDDHNPVTTADNPKYFIIFGLSTHKLIYHLIIAKTCPDHDHPKTGEYVDIPYSEKDEVGNWKTGYSPSDNKTKRIYGTTQRDLSDTYQLGSTIFGRSYSYDAGEVSIGDVLKVPSVFDRPNCVFFFYVDNIQTAGATTFQKTATDEENMVYQANNLETVGYYYFKIGTETYTYKRVHVTTAKGEETSADYTVVDCTVDDYNYAWQDNATLNNSYKGLEITRLMSEPALIGGLVQINIGYAFQTGLETNAGEGFVTSLNQNLWYTFETKDGVTPYLAHYTNAWGLQAMPGLDTRYTNDYLWCPLGDVYGFKMYNRYMIKNSGGVNNVMTTDDISEGQNLKMAVSTSGKEVYELLISNTHGYFLIHPVINNTGTQYYVKKDPSDDYAKLSKNYSEWTFNLPPDLLKPYIERKGYVGGLTKDAYDDNKTVLDKVMDGTASYADLLTVQGIVYDDDNIVKYKPGYYRLHNQPGVSKISPIRYASGYLHKTEMTGDGINTTGPIPMHFYSKAGTSTTFGSSGLKNGYTESKATQGDIPVLATEYDPSTIFYFGGNTTLDGNPRSTMQTQGLYVAANPMGDIEGETNEKEGKGTNRLQRAVMKETENPAEDAITFSLMDIGGAVLLIHDGATPAQRRYLNFDQSNFFQRTATDDPDMTTQVAKLTSKGTYYFKIGDGSYTYKKIKVISGYVASSLTPATYNPAESSSADEWTKAADIYDLKYYHDSPADDAKWCMVSADSLMITTNNGGDGYYYTTFCAPFDVQLPNDVAADNDKETPAKDYYAYICEEWNEEILHPRKVGQFNTGTHANDNKFIPAGTPVIIRTTDNSESIKLTFPSTSPTSALNNCIFTGKYLEQLLDDGGGNEVYTLGLPFISNIEKDKDYNTNGNIDAPLPEQANTGVGFYINANPNKEHNPLQSLWLRNNRYVLHNKIYYRAGATPGASAPQQKGPEFVPVIFDDLEEQDEELNPNGAREIVGDGCVYDLMGRKVATREQVEDGSWKQRVATGIYILNGKKFQKK